MEDFQTGEETSFAVDEVSGIIKDVSIITCIIGINNIFFDEVSKHEVAYRLLFSNI